MHREEPRLLRRLSFFFTRDRYYAMYITITRERPRGERAPTYGAHQSGELSEKLWEIMERCRRERLEAKYNLRLVYTRRAIQSHLTIVYVRR